MCRASFSGSLTPALVGALLLVIPPACQHPESGSTEQGEAKTKSEAERAQVVATIGETQITAGDIADELGKQNPYIRARFASPLRRKEYIKNLVRFEVLAREAKRRGLHRDPEVIKRVKRAMIDRLVEELNSSLVKLDDVTDKEVEAYFQKNRKLFFQAARVRASQILVATQTDAQRLLAQARRKPTDVRYFAELVREHSLDAATKPRGGDLGFFSREDSPLPREVVEAAFAIPGLWQLAGPVKTEKGFLILMKTGESEEIKRTLADERNRIKNRLFNEKRMKAVERFMEDLQAKAKVEINEATLAKVQVNQESDRAPARETSTPPPAAPPRP